MSDGAEQRRSGRGALSYLTIAAVQRGMSFLALPLFASALGPVQYGQITVLLTIYGLVTVILPAGLEVPLFRALFLPADSAEREPRLRSLVTFLFVAPVLAGAALSLVALALPELLDLDRGHLALYLLTAGVFIAATVAPLTIARAEERLGAYAAISLGYAVVNTGLRILLVAVLDEGVRGWVLADLGAAAATLLFSLGVQRRWLSTAIDRGRLREGLRLGVPLIPHQGAHWALTLSDRLVVAAVVAPAAVGVYGIAAQVALVSTLSVTELARAFMPRYGEASHGGTDLARLRPFVRQQVVWSLGLVAVVTIASAQAVHLVLPESYRASADLIPWLALGSACLGLYYVPMNLLTIVQGNTAGVWRYSLTAALVNLGLNVVLVPRYGLVAAAVDTALAYATLLALVSLAAHRSAATTGLAMRTLGWPCLSIGLTGAGFSVLATVDSGVGLLTAAIGVGVVGALTFVEGRGDGSRPARAAAVAGG